MPPINARSRPSPWRPFSSRDEIREAAGAPPAEGELAALSIWQQEAGRVGSILEQIPAAKHRRALESFKASTPERWPEALLASLNHVSAKLAAEVAHALISGGKLDGFKELLARLISQHQASSDLLLWLARERSDCFADILGPEVFRAMLTAMERDQFNEKRSNKLRDYILDDQTLLVELIGSADLEVIKDLTRALQLSPCFDDMDKRSLLARIVKSYPAVQTMISGEQTRQDTSFLVSWESLERRKNEYAELVQKSIPANSKEIAVARSYGDLRENHEYKAAKEMQKILMRRKGELESQLVRARGTDFANPRTDVVSIGTQVSVTDLEQQHAEHFIILGAWDSNPGEGHHQLFDTRGPVPAQPQTRRKKSKFRLKAARNATGSTRSCLLSLCDPDTRNRVVVGGLGDCSRRGAARRSPNPWSGQRQYAPDRDVEIHHVALDVTPDFKHRTISAEAVLTFHPIAKPLEELQLDAVDLDIQSVDFDRENRGLRGDGGPSCHYVCRRHSAGQGGQRHHPLHRAAGKGPVFPHPGNGL